MKYYEILSIKDLECEKWGIIEDFPGYLVSSLGRIKSVGRKVPHKNHFVNVKEIIKKQRLDHNGYPVVSLCIKTKYKSKLVHRLVAKAFINNELSKPYVNHINGVKTDNRVDNLEWVTNSENLLHAYRVLKIKLPESKVKKKVYQFTKSGKLIKEWDSRTNAANFLGISVSGIINAACGRGKVAGGFMWSNAKYIKKDVVRSYKEGKRYIFINGEMLCHSEAERKLGFKQGSIYSRLKLGWDIEKIIKTSNKL